MRDIRFRAWDKEKKKMYHDSNLGQFFMSYDEHDDWELMQFTGLKDKNGKEIWEGDLLQFENDKDAFYEVFYHDDEARFKCCRTHYQNNRCGGSVPEITSKRLEVIGNVFENPKLLRKELK